MIDDTMRRELANGCNTQPNGIYERSLLTSQKEKIFLKIDKINSVMYRFPSKQACNDT